MYSRELLWRHSSAVRLRVRRLADGSRWCLVSGVTALLAACGGGGGGSPATSGPLPSETLVDFSTLEPYGIGDKAAVALKVSSDVWAMARNVSDILDLTLRPNVDVDVSDRCWPTSGAATVPKLTVHWQDSDGNSKISAGDVVKIEASQCGTFVLSSVIDGRVDVQVAQAGSSAAAQLEAQVSIPSGVAYASGAIDGRLYGDRLVGTFKLSRTLVDGVSRLRAYSSPADDLRWERSRSGRTVTDRYRSFDVQRTFDQRSGRNSLSIQTQFDSELLGARLSMRTAEPWSAPLNMAPDQGRFLVDGATKQIVEVTPYINDLPRALSDGFRVHLVGRPATDDFVKDWGYCCGEVFWWDEFAKTGGQYAGPPMNRFRRGVVEVVYRHNLGSDVWPELVWQFSRDLSDFPRPEVVIDGCPVDAPAASPCESLIADVRVEGAQWRVKAPVQLHHNWQYRVSFAEGGVALSSQYKDMSNVSGTYRFQMQSLLDQFTTAATLQSVVMRPAGFLAANGKPVTLDGSGSLSTRGAVSSYEWRQTSGPTLALGSAFRAATDLQLVSEPTNPVEIASVALTVRDATGEVESSEVKVPVVRSDQLRKLVYLAAAADGTGRVSPLGGPSAFVVSRVSAAAGAITVVATSIYGDFHADFLTLSPVPLTPGTYAVSDTVLTQGGVAVNLGVAGRDCNLTAGGAVQLLELEMGAGGEVTKLALDLRGPCTGAEPALVGSVRFNSELPFQR